MSLLLSDFCFASQFISYFRYKVFKFSFLKRKNGEVSFKLVAINESKKKINNIAGISIMRQKSFANFLIFVVSSNVKSTELFSALNFTGSCFNKCRGREKKIEHFHIEGLLLAEKCQVTILVIGSGSVYRFRLLYPLHCVCEGRITYILKFVTVSKYIDLFGKEE